MSFDPQAHMLKIKRKTKDGTYSKDYLEVAWRIVWFREAFPRGGIRTEPVPMGDLLLFRAEVFDENGALLATGWASVRSGTGQTWAGREIEKCETAAIGRALGAAGFGSQFEADEEGEYLTDSPVDTKPSDGRKHDAETLNATEFFTFAKSLKLSNPQALSALGVERVGDWQGTRDEAYQRVEDAAKKLA